MERKILGNYLNVIKELKTTKRILDKLRSQPKIVMDSVKDYKTGYPHNVTIEGYDVITDFKIKLYEDKQKRLIEEEKEALLELNKIIETINDPVAKSVFEYRYIAGMRFEEIAIKTNNTYENVRNIYYRTIRKMTQNDTKKGI